MDTELSELMTVFQSFDMDSSGRLSVEEVRQGPRAEHGQTVHAPRHALGQTPALPWRLAAKGRQGAALLLLLRAMRRPWRPLGHQVAFPPLSPQLQRALKILGVKMSLDEAALLLKEVDTNGDGEVGGAACTRRLCWCCCWAGGRQLTRGFCC